MPYAASNAASDATNGSNHSSAIMIIPECYEYRHPPLSRMDTPDSDNMLRPKSRNQVVSYRSATGPLTVTGSSNQSASGYQIAPYPHALSRASNGPPRQSHPSEFRGGYNNAVRWIADQQTLQRDSGSQVSPPSQSTAGPLHTQSRQPGGRRSSSGWAGPMIALGLAAAIANTHISGSSDSRRNYHDRGNAERPFRKYRDDDSNTDNRSHRSRRPRGSRDDDNSDAAYVRHAERHERHEQRIRDHHGRDDRREKRRNSRRQSG